jgi:hypothetical protein
MVNLAQVNRLGFGVVVSLIIDGLQVRQNTGRRSSATIHNSHGWSNGRLIRRAIAKTGRTSSELMTDWRLHGEKVLDPADQLRLEQMLPGVCNGASFHIWDRTQRGVLSPPGTFELRAGAQLNIVHREPRAATAWVARREAYWLRSRVLPLTSPLCSRSLQGAKPVRRRPSNRDPGKPRSAFLTAPESPRVFCFNSPALRLSLSGRRRIADMSARVAPGTRGSTCPVGAVSLDAAAPC